MRRRVAVGLVGAVLAAGGAYGLFGRDTAPGLREGSAAVDGPLVEIEDEPIAYHVTYRVEDRTDGDTNVTTDRVWVQRPFESRLETWRGPPPGEEQIAVEVAAFGRLATGSVDQDRLVTAVPPGVAASDARVAPILGLALEAGVAERRERREVVGRACQVYRSSGFFTAPALEPPAKDTYADTCLDRHGIALEEVLVLDDAVRHRRVAVDLEIGRRADAELFDTGAPTAPVEEGGGSVRSVDAASRPQGEFWEPPGLDIGLPGFHHRGRYSVIPPQGENFADPMRSDHIVAGVSDVWVDGADFVVVDQGGTLRGARPFVPGEDTPRVAVGDLGEAELLLSPRGSELRVLLGDGRYVRVYGTVTPDELSDVARRLQRTEGSGLTFDDD